MGTKSIVIGCLVCCFPVFGNEVFDAALDWDVTRGNPNGTWSYGTYDSGTVSEPTAFLPFETGELAQEVGVEIWRMTDRADPNITRNPSAVAIEVDGLVWAPEALILGSSSGSSVVRFTVPRTGFYKVELAFGGNPSPAFEGDEVVALNWNRRPLLADPSSLQGRGGTTNSSLRLCKTINYRISDTLGLPNAFITRVPRAHTRSSPESAASWGTCEAGQYGWN